MSADERLPEEWLLGQFIPLHYHYNMLRDRARMDPFAEAIARTVPVGGTVVEFGGGTGVLSYFAAQRAAKVWCVELNPALVRAARQFLSNNRHGDRVEVISADAMTWLPPEPVDVVVCEMLHVALIREKQIAVLRSFQERYLAAFGPPLPICIPDTSVLGFQLREQDYCFSGYMAPVPLFLDPNAPVADSRPLADAQIYDTVDYRREIPTEFIWDESTVIHTAGRLNAISFLTNNFLAFVLSEQRSVNWLMNQLVLPLPTPLTVRPGDEVTVRFHYRAGDPLEALQDAITVERAAATIPLRRAA